MPDFSPKIAKNEGLGGRATMDFSYPNNHHINKSSQMEQLHDPTNNEFYFFRLMLLSKIDIDVFPLQVYVTQILNFPRLYVYNFYKMFQPTEYNQNLNIFRRLRATFLSFYIIYMEDVFA